MKQNKNNKSLPTGWRLCEKGSGAWINTSVTRTTIKKQNRIIADLTKQVQALHSKVSDISDHLRTQ